MVVRKSRKIIGGYRGFKAGLTEQAARDWAAFYKTPSEAVREEDLIEPRTKALRGLGETIGEARRGSAGVTDG